MKSSLVNFSRSIALVWCRQNVVHCVEEYMELKNGKWRVKLFKKERWLFKQKILSGNSRDQNIEGRASIERTFENIVKSRA